MPQPKITAYIADDHAIVRQGLRDMLEHHDIQVVGEANSYADALAHCYDKKPDVLIVDLNMELDNGILGIKSILDKYPDAKIIIYSMRESIGTIYETYQQGVKGYVTKRSDMDCLVDAVNRVTSGKNYYLPELVDKILSYSFNNYADANPSSVLSEQELDIFIRLATGESNKDIADSLNITTKTVANRISDIKQKLKIPLTSFEWVARKSNLLPLDL